MLNGSGGDIILWRHKAECSNPSKVVVFFPLTMTIKLNELNELQIGPMLHKHLFHIHMTIDGHPMQWGLSVLVLG